MMGNRPWQSAAEMLANWQHDVLHGPPPMMLPSGLPLDLPVGRIVLLGGAPNSGKSTLAMQATIDALRTMADLRAVVASVEMTPPALLDKQLARLAHVDCGRLMNRNLRPEERDRLPVGFAALESIADRLTFVLSRDLDAVAQAADDGPAGPLLIVLDYLQAMTLAAGEHRDRRGLVDAMMQTVRAWADAGVCVLVVSAAGRTRDAKGNSGYGGLGLGSFKESGAIEYAADLAYLLVEAADEHKLHCVKNRYGPRVDSRLRFDGGRQRFAVLGNPPRKRSREA